jgi:hypothetical protein
LRKLFYFTDYFGEKEIEAAKSLGQIKINAHSAIYYAILGL